MYIKVWPLQSRPLFILMLYLFVLPLSQSAAPHVIQAAERNVQSTPFPSRSSNFCTRIEYEGSVFQPSALRLWCDDGDIVIDIPPWNAQGARLHSSIYVLQASVRSGTAIVRFTLLTTEGLMTCTLTRVLSGEGVSTPESTQDGGCIPYKDPDRMPGTIEAELVSV